MKLDNLIWNWNNEGILSYPSFTYVCDKLHIFVFIKTYSLNKRKTNLKMYKDLVVIVDILVFARLKLCSLLKVPWKKLIFTNYQENTTKMAKCSKKRIKVFLKN